MKRIVCVFLTILLLTSCKGKGDAFTVERDENGVLKASREIFAMDTHMQVTCYGKRCKSALQASLDEIRRLDALFSVGQEGSEIARLNQTGEATLSSDGAKVLTEALRISNMTDGAFDCTVYPVMQLWGFPSSHFRVPTQNELKTALLSVGSAKLHFDTKSNRVSLDENVGIDFGGIAKGYTSDRLMEIFREYDLVSGCVSLGGNVQFYKKKTDGSLWRCGIKDPDDPESDSYLGVLSTSDTAVITSGAYERFFTDEKTGKTYHHIIDPKTGYPSDNGLRSVTVVSKHGITADALSTALYVMGQKKAKAFWREHRDEFDMILQTDDKTVYVTQPLADSFTSDFTVKMIDYP